MKIHFPQWQGSGSGNSIKYGSETIYKYLANDAIIPIGLSNIPAGKNGKQRNCINNYDAIWEQLNDFKTFLDSNKPKSLQIIGGDCGLEIVPVSYLNHQYPNLGVIWFDAHADINKPCESPSCNFHGMPLRTLLGEGEILMKDLLFSTIENSQIHYVGLRDIDEAENVRINKGDIYAPQELNCLELTKTLKSKSITHLYLHFDVDCLEPSEYDKTYYQVPNGLTIKEAEEAIIALQTDFTVVGSSILESVATNNQELLPITKIIDLLMK